MSERQHVFLLLGAACTRLFVERFGGEGALLYAKVANKRSGLWCGSAAGTTGLFDADCLLTP